MTVLATGEIEFVGQPRQAELPVNCLYVPAKHCEHVAPFAPEYPALHWHAVFTLLPAAETELARQAAHSEFPT